jgi:hypothetical protein
MRGQKGHPVESVTTACECAECRALESTSVQLAVTAGTQCDQIVQCIVAQLTSLNLMMYLQVSQRTATLTPPRVSFEHAVAKKIVFFYAELQSRSLLAKFLHYPSKIRPLERSHQLESQRRSSPGNSPETCRFPA